MTSVQDGSGIDPTLLVCAPEAPQAAAPSSTPSPGTKRAADPAAEQPPVKVARSSEEEKKARLLARQQRNRQSAQVSREKKKAHIEQLEQEVQQLREEKKAWAARDFEAQQKQRQLESQVSDLGAKVHNLETLLVRLVQHSQASKETVSHDAIPSQLTQIVSALSTHRSVDERVAGAEAASAAPAVAPSSVVPTQRLSPSSDSTCLPAAGAEQFQELEQRGGSTRPEMADATTNGSSIAGWLPDYMLAPSLDAKPHNLADADDPHAPLGSWMSSASASDSVADPFAPVVYGPETTGHTPDAHAPVNTDMDMNLLLSTFTPSDTTHASGSLSCSTTPPSQLGAEDDVSATSDPGVDATLFPAHEFLDLDLALDPLPMDTMDKVLFPSIGAEIAV